MGLILDAHLFHNYCDTLDLARSGALIEAANTGGAVLQVRSIEIHYEVLRLIGPIPAAAISRTTHGQDWRSTIRCRSLGNFYTTWAALLRAPEGALGFLVLHHPLTLQSAQAAGDRDE